MQYNGRSWSTMLVHGFDHVLLNGITVFDHGCLVDHGRVPLCLSLHPQSFFWVLQYFITTLTIVIEHWLDKLNDWLFDWLTDWLIDYYTIDWMSKPRLTSSRLTELQCSVVDMEPKSTTFWSSESQFGLVSLAAHYTDCLVLQNVFVADCSLPNILYLHSGFLKRCFISFARMTKV